MLACSVCATEREMKYYCSVVKTVEMWLTKYAARLENKVIYIRIETPPTSRLLDNKLQ